MKKKLYFAMMSVKKYTNSMRVYVWQSSTFKDEVLAKAALRQIKQEAKDCRYLITIEQICECDIPHKESVTCFERRNEKS